MPLQNRVTPFGEICALPGRGTMMGNRGILHDDERRIVRPWQVKRWIACELEFRGRHRNVMTPHRYTELFFLDEATAYAAGHRPCRECRYAAYERFRTLWEQSYGGRARADAMDLRLHAERVNGKAKRMHRAEIAGLPDGTYVAIDKRAWLLFDGGLYAWSDTGYAPRRQPPRHAVVDVLTPKSIVNLFRCGLVPSVHPTAK